MTMSSKGRNLARNIGKSLRKKFGDSEGRHDQPQILSFAALPAEEMSTTLRERPVEAHQSSSPATQKASGSLRMKSSSLGSIHCNDSDPKIVDHNDIIALTQDVKSFSDALAKLKTVFTEASESGDDARVTAHERLGEVLCILKNVLQRYPALHSTDLFSAAGALIGKIKSHDYHTELSSEELQLFCDAIDQLALSFSSSVSEYLMGDIEPDPGKQGKAKSYDDLADLKPDPEGSVGSRKEVSALSGEELDTALVRLEAGLDLALQRSKAWSKYARDILNYMDKKIQLESEYAKNLTRLAQTMRPVLSEEGFLPLQSVYCTVLSQDVEFASNFQTTHLLLQAGKFCEPLAQRRLDHDKVRRVVKETWNREIKKMQDAMTNLRKAQALYISRQQDYERARDQTNKADGDKAEKRRKLEEESMLRAAEAETTYKACVAEANHRQQQIEKIKTELLGKLREQIHLSDHTMKSVTIEYFQLMESATAPLPVQFHTLWESSHQYEPGSQYAEFIQRLPLAATNNIRSEPFSFQPYIPDSSKSQDGDRKSSVHSNGSSDQVPSQENSPSLSSRKDKYRAPVKAWGQTVPNSDTDSASGSNKSHDSSPSNTPHTLRRQLVSSLSLDEMEEEKENVEVEKKGPMKRTLTVGGEGSLDLPGILKQHQGRRNTTFGVDFQEQVAECHADIPPIITLCLAEIEKRGMHIKGMYRVSGVKSKVENLCNQFDLDPDSVDLGDQHPNVICNVLKLYLRQLPEPLLTFKLYSEFIHLTKDHVAGLVSPERTVDLLHKLVHSLPTSNLRTCAVLIHHLQRVTARSDENHMTAANLGIVFGPTLLRPCEGAASLTSLVDTPHQTKCVELLISSAQSIFGPGEEFQVVPGETPVESLPGHKAPEKQPEPAPSEPVPAITSSAKDSGKDTLLLADETAEDAEEDKGPGAEFFLPGCSLGQADSTAAGVAPAPTGSSDEGLSEWEELQSDEDLPDSLLPDGSRSQSQAPHKPLLTPHCMAGAGARPVPKSVLKSPPSAAKFSLRAPLSSTPAVGPPTSPENLRPKVVTFAPSTQFDAAHGASPVLGETPEGPFRLPSSSPVLPAEETKPASAGTPSPSLSLPAESRGIPSPPAARTSAPSSPTPPSPSHSPPSFPARDPAVSILPPSQSIILPSASVTAPESPGKPSPVVEVPGKPPSGSRLSGSLLPLPTEQPPVDAAQVQVKVVSSPALPALPPQEEVVRQPATALKARSVSESHAALGQMEVSPAPSQTRSLSTSSPEPSWEGRDELAGIEDGKGPGGITSRSFQASRAELTKRFLASTISSASKRALPHMGTTSGIGVATVTRPTTTMVSTGAVKAAAAMAPLMSPSSSTGSSPTRSSSLTKAGTGASGVSSKSSLPASAGGQVKAPTSTSSSAKPSSSSDKSAPSLSKNSGTGIPSPASSLSSLASRDSSPASSSSQTLSKQSASSSPAKTTAGSAPTGAPKTASQSGSFGKGSSSGSSTAPGYSRVCLRQRNSSPTSSSATRRSSGGAGSRGSGSKQANRRSLEVAGSSGNRRSSDLSSSVPPSGAGAGTPLQAASSLRRSLDLSGNRPASASAHGTRQRQSSGDSDKGSGRGRGKVEKAVGATSAASSLSSSSVSQKKFHVKCQGDSGGEGPVSGSGGSGHGLSQDRTPRYV